MGLFRNWVIWTKTLKVGKSQIIVKCKQGKYICSDFHKSPQGLISSKYICTAILVNSQFYSVVNNAKLSTNQIGTRCAK